MEWARKNTVVGATVMLSSCPELSTLDNAMGRNKLFSSEAHVHLM